MCWRSNTVSPRNPPASKRRSELPQLCILEDRTTPAVDVLVNDNAGATTTGYFTQSETTLLAFDNTVLVGFNDSGS